jgi:membrane-anchored protein YejM (alkaline phosphatase superfamily)
LDQQTATLKETYDALCASLSVTNQELNKSFKEKLHTLKAMCATFFAKIETQVGENNRKVDKIQVSHDKFEATFVNPAKEVDAKVFAMKESLQHEERTRET